MHYLKRTMYKVCTQKIQPVFDSIDIMNAKNLDFSQRMLMRSTMNEGENQLQVFLYMLH